jgi:hypothetical protein
MKEANPNDHQGYLRLVRLCARSKARFKTTCPGIDDLISHGICPQCLQKALCDIRPADDSAIK